MARKIIRYQTDGNWIGSIRFNSQTEEKEFESTSLCPNTILHKEKLKKNTPLRYELECSEIVKGPIKITLEIF